VGSAPGDYLLDNVIGLVLGHLVNGSLVIPLP